MVFSTYWVKNHKASRRTPEVFRIKEWTEGGLSCVKGRKEWTEGWLGFRFGQVS